MGSIKTITDGGAVSQPAQPAVAVSQPAVTASLSPIFLSDSSESEVSDSEFNGLGAELLSQLSDSGQLITWAYPMGYVLCSVGYIHVQYRPAAT